MLKRKEKQLHEQQARGEEHDGSDFSGDTSSTTSSSEESEVEGALGQRRINKILLLSSRGINSRQRHLLKDFSQILQHSKRENKLDTKNDLYELNELAELDDCTHCVFFEARKPSELFMWMSSCPSGPSIRFHVLNICTADELNMLGNFSYGTRPILSFDPMLSSTKHGEIIQKVLTSIFNVPAGHRKGDRHAFYDHVFHFSLLDDKIWFRNYQIQEGAAADVVIDGMSLVEVGPRFVLNPIKIFQGSFRGNILWANSIFKSPAELRAAAKRNMATKYANRQSAQHLSAIRKGDSFMAEEHDPVFD